MQRYEVNIEYEGSSESHRFSDLDDAAEFYNDRKSVGGYVSLGLYDLIGSETLEDDSRDNTQH